MSLKPQIFEFLNPKPDTLLFSDTGTGANQAIFETLGAPNFRSLKSLQDLLTPEFCILILLGMNL